eukprot:6201165-Amphidinium_carterae.2
MALLLTWVASVSDQNCAARLVDVLERLVAGPPSETVAWVALPNLQKTLPGSLPFRRKSSWVGMFVKACFVARLLLRAAHYAARGTTCYFSESHSISKTECLSLCTGPVHYREYGASLYGAQSTTCPLQGYQVKLLHAGTLQPQYKCNKHAPYAICIEQHDNFTDHGIQARTEPATCNNGSDNLAIDKCTR